MFYPSDLAPRVSTPQEREESLKNEITDAWRRGTPKRDLGDIAQALRAVMGQLRAWSTEKFDNVCKELENSR
jgi:hypothetical protein